MKWYDQSLVSNETSTPILIKIIHFSDGKIQVQDYVLHPGSAAFQTVPKHVPPVWEVVLPLNTTVVSSPARYYVYYNDLMLGTIPNTKQHSDKLLEEILALHNKPSTFFQQEKPKNSWRIVKGSVC